MNNSADFANAIMCGYGALLQEIAQHSMDKGRIFCWGRMHKEEDDGAQKLRHPLFIISIYSTSWIPEISLSMISE